VCFVLWILWAVTGYERPPEHGPSQPKGDLRRRAPVMQIVLSAHGASKRFAAGVVAVPCASTTIPASAAKVTAEGRHSRQRHAHRRVLS
jgi:hypothetical protein